jgi:hypothetical protein
MSRQATLRIVKKLLLPGVFAAALAVGIHATSGAAEGASPLWSVVVHIEYQNGTVYEGVLATGVPSEMMSAILAECGRSHWTGSVVRYHCYPVAD